MKLLHIALAVGIFAFNPIAFSQTTSTGPTLTASWKAVTTGNNGTVTLTSPVTYNLYQGPTCTNLTRIQTGITSTTTTVTTGLTPGSSYCFVASAVSGGVESAQSNSAQITIPLPTPDAPGQITIVLH